MFKYLIMALAFVGIVVFTSFSGQEYFARQNTQLVSYEAGAYLTNSDVKPASDFKMGDTVIINFTFVRQPVDCFADYVTILTGKDAIFQWPMRRSFGIYTKVTTVKNHLALILPTDMPEGDYQIKQLVFPTCSSFNLSPFDPGLSLKIHLHR